MSLKLPSLARLLLVSLLAFAFVAAPLPPVAQGAAREPVRAKHGMVASQSKLASEVGVDVLRRGGNAVDAAVAVALTMAVTYPEAGNIGGGGFMLMRFKDGRAMAIDYREKAPAAASRNVYVNDRGELIRGEGSSTSGYRASGVPGTVAGLALALEKYGSGKFKWAQLIEPARKLALNGFPLTHRILNVIRGAEKELAPYKDSKRIFLNEGKYYEEGDILRQPELAATLTRLQKQGPREFYEGQTAQLIAADMKRHNGLITLDDLKKYQPTERTPPSADSKLNKPAMNQIYIPFPRPHSLVFQSLNA